jgi:putative endonuclease
MAKHLKQGQQAESLAAQYLTNRGYQILEKNYRSGRAEVDIIGQIGALIVFIEVKSLQKTFYGNPEDRIGEHKKHMLFQAANDYQMDKNWHKEIRFDAISVNFYPQAIKIEHFEDAFS